MLSVNRNSVERHTPKIRYSRYGPDDCFRMSLLSLTLVFVADSNFNLVRIKVWGGLEVRTRYVKC